MKIQGVDFPEPLLNALRDGRLVVFAGAGVSMGPPAELPSFRKLAERMAEGTDKLVTGPEDRFLGQLEGDGVTVRQRAAEILQLDNLEPNTLHRNLLRLFKKAGPVRIVTTNFDCLFDQAADAGDLFKAKPKVFEAPALPPGSRFEDIVDQPIINWNKERGSDIKSPTWRYLFNGNHINDHHLTMGKRHTARQADEFAKIIQEVNRRNTAVVLTWQQKIQEVSQ